MCTLTAATATEHTVPPCEWRGIDGRRILLERAIGPKGDLIYGQLNTFNDDASFIAVGPESQRLTTIGIMYLVRVLHGPTRQLHLGTGYTKFG